MTTLIWMQASTVMDQLGLDGLMPPLSKSDQERALRYIQAMDRYQFVLGRLLLGYGLRQQGRGLEGLQELCYGEEGKPYLEGIAFNIAHSRGVVACAWSAPQPLGLDVEVPRAIQRTHFRHCFTPMEWANIEQDTSLETFYHYWTAKEAVLKAKGWGLAHLQEVQIEAAGAVSILGEPSDLVWQRLSLGDAKACLCQAGPTEAAVAVQQLELESLLEGLGR